MVAMVTKLLFLRHYRQGSGRQEAQSVRLSMNGTKRQNFIHSSHRSTKFDSVYQALHVSSRDQVRIHEPFSFVS